MSINWDAFLPATPEQLLGQLRTRPFIFLAEAAHDVPAIQFGMNRVFAGLAGHVRHVCLENEPRGFHKAVEVILPNPERLQVALALTEASAPKRPSSVMGIRIASPALEQRFAIAKVNNIGLHGVDVAPGNIYDDDTGTLIAAVLNARLRADQNVAQAIRSAAQGAPVLTTYGMGHFGRHNSIETYFDPTERASVAFFTERQDANTHYPKVMQQNLVGGQPRQLHEWADYVCCVKSGEIWRNNNFKP